MPLYTGTSKAETIVGSAGDDSIFGLEGNDRLITLDNDPVEGGPVDDEINAFYSVQGLAFLVYPSSGTK